jgi:hypothetical protein
MSYALQSLLPEAFLINSHDKETLRFAFLHMVKHVSPKSYLLRATGSLRVSGAKICGGSVQFLCDCPAAAKVNIAIVAVFLYNYYQAVRRPIF